MTKSSHTYPAPPAKDGIGDLDSDEIGTGARFNSGKPPLELIPVRALCQGWRNDLEGMPELSLSLDGLADLQEGDNSGIHRALAQAVQEYGVEDAARVLDFGRKKYKEWNWAKGMPWSVCIGCALRHANHMVLSGTDSVDEDSGLPHSGHYICNLIFLHHYVTHYPELDDRPPANLFGGDR